MYYKVAEALLCISGILLTPEFDESDASWKVINLNYYIAHKSCVVIFTRYWEKASAQKAPNLLRGSHWVILFWSIHATNRSPLCMDSRRSRCNKEWGLWSAGSEFHTDKWIKKPPLFLKQRSHSYASFSAWVVILGRFAWVGRAPSALESFVPHH
jgi:hypothetical protein